MIKKTAAIIFTFILLISVCIPAFAQDTQNPLSFNEDGKFTVVHLTDSHLDYPLYSVSRNYICEMLDTVKPDLVVLGGDTITESTSPNGFSQNPFESTLKELCEMFTCRGVYFTFVFGNHDRQNGMSGTDMLALYRQYGGEYFLGYDAEPSLTGEGTHDLQVMSSDGTRVALNLFMFDSGDSVFDENGKNLGYDSVHPDQIEWYKERSEALKNENGGTPVPALAFQHIIVQEIDDFVFYPVKNSAGALGEDFDGKHILFTPIPKIRNIKSGVIMEKPCPGYYNYGQLDAMAQQGDVFAIFSGHDHSNTFTVNIKGIDVVNSGGCKHQAPLRLFTSGARVITVDENNPRDYESSMLTFIDLGTKPGSHIFENSDIKTTDILLTKMWLAITGLAMRFVHLFSAVC